MNNDFLDNENEDGDIVVPAGARVIQHHLLLTGEESDTLYKMADAMDLSTHGVLKQALRVLQMYRAGRLAPVLDDMEIGGCGE